MNIFFTGSVRGGRTSQPEYAHIVKRLEEYGTVTSRYASDETLSEYGETRLSDEEILKRELAALAACDVVIADVTTPSLGVGYLIATARKLGKRVIALYRGTDTLKLSGIIRGDAAVEVHTYETVADIDAILTEALS